MSTAASVEWIVASTEVDALMLEYSLIKEHRPRFNIRYRDDKSYPYLALTVGETWPRAQVLRGPKRKNVRHFGPFGHAYAIRETLDALTRVFPVRTCSNAFFDQRARARRPCLYYDIGRCAGPCVPEVTGVTEVSYRAHVDALADFLAGNERPVLARLEREMREASDREEFELAANLRDRVAAAHRAMESQEMVLTQPQDLDVVGLVEDDLEAAFQAFFVRKGRVMGRKGWVVDRVEELDRPQLVGSFVRELYMERDEVPPRILVPELPDGAEVLAEWLSSRRETRRNVRRPRARRQAQADGDRHRERPRALPAAQAAPGVRLRCPVPRAGGARQMPSASSRRLCGSSATTSRTSARATRWARWWCSRTASRSAPTTGGSRSRTCPDRTTTRAWRRCSAAGSRGSRQRWRTPMPSPICRSIRGRGVVSPTHLRSS